MIVRTAAEGVTTEEIEHDVRRLLDQWNQIDALAKRSQAPALLYREPDMAVRVIREEFNNDYRGVVIDDRDLYESVRDYVSSISPELADRVEFFDPDGGAAARSTRSSTSTSSSTRRSTARCGCRRAAR